MITWASHPPDKVACRRCEGLADMMSASSSLRY